jgi:hypothetical protein
MTMYYTDDIMMLLSQEDAKIERCNHQYHKYTGTENIDEVSG